MTNARFIRVTRHPENLPGQLEAIDRALEGSEWKRVGYFAPPSRDIGLQRLPGRGTAMTPAEIRFMFGDVPCRIEVYGPLGYLISGDDEPESA